MPGCRDSCTNVRVQLSLAGEVSGYTPSVAGTCIAVCYPYRCSFFFRLQLQLRIIWNLVCCSRCSDPLCVVLEPVLYSSPVGTSRVLSNIPATRSVARSSVAVCHLSGSQRSVCLYPRTERRTRTDTGDQHVHTGRPNSQPSWTVLHEHWWRSNLSPFAMRKLLLVLVSNEKDDQFQMKNDGLS